MYVHFGTLKRFEREISVTILTYLIFIDSEINCILNLGIFRIKPVKPSQASRRVRCLSSE